MKWPATTRTTTWCASTAGPLRNCPTREVKPFFDRLEREHQFTVLTNHLALFGLCKNCRPQTGS